MDRRRVSTLYEEFVVQPNLERTALLQTLRSLCGRSPTLLYPGSSIHITPSFIFQHVVYVDLSEFATAFFKQRDGVLDVINRHRKYRQSPYLQFISQDFTAPLPIRKESFDILLSLYAGGICQTCVQYVKPGGMVLTNDHHKDALQASSLSDTQLEAVIDEKRGKIKFVDEDLRGYLSTPQHPQSQFRKKSIRHHYDRSADYYLFRKLPFTAKG